ncbi:TetR/AcrR family transcriptional regulator [Cytobacillus oceanisediminis]|uniref:HTH tetR-type domain-containing protein n=1 Tax=Cytobacillus oceanisediminis TaxID=665099 RepID=A0ABX3CYS1_9BACI|nr:TetR/AcrR family transcriptional regulator [Cytobacillus oceanisediminis]OHX50661.1 hypothetical protein BBV17_06475 [Cytobacillus oceanisediminis]
MNKRQLQALETKKRILKIALELFQEKGFSNVTVDEIIEKSQTSKGAFYNHFKSKHDIFFEKFQEVDQYYVQKLEPEFHLFNSAEEKLGWFFFKQMEYIELNLGWDVIRTIYEHELNVEAESFFLIPDRPLYQILGKLCDEGKRNGELRTDLSTEEMVDIFARTIRGILYDWGINKGAFSLQNEQRFLFDAVIRGLKK